MHLSINVELEVLRACSTALSGGAYSFAVGSSGRLAGSTEGFLTTAEVNNVLREAGAPLWYSGFSARRALKQDL